MEIIFLINVALCSVFGTVFISKPPCFTLITHATLVNLLRKEKEVKDESIYGVSDRETVLKFILNVLHL